VQPQHFTAESLKALKQKKLSRSKKDGDSKTKVLFPNGNILPRHIRLFFSPLMINVPLEDFDPFYTGAEVRLNAICIGKEHY